MPYYYLASEQEQVTVYQAAKKRGLTVFDSALPDTWRKKVIEITGRTPVGHVVWCYDKVPYGIPVGITEEGDKLISICAGAI